MVGRCVPGTFEQLHSAEFLQRNTTPVGRRANCLQSTATLPAILITQHTALAFVIPAQPVRAEPPIPAVIAGSNGTSAHHGRPNQLVDVLDRLDLRLDNTHLLYDIRLLQSSSMDSIIYNTVILAFDCLLRGNRSEYKTILDLVELMRRNGFDPDPSNAVRTICDRLLPVIETMPGDMRSEEHTSELQSLRHLVCRLL